MSAILADSHTATGEKWVSILLMCEAGTALLFCPIFGYLVDRASTRRFPFLGALGILGGCMVVLHTSHSLTMFVVGRLLQGCAGALVVAAFALLTDSVPAERLGQTIGYLGSAIASGFLLGPFIGGLVYHSAGYDAVFWVAYSIIAVDLGMRVVMIEKKVAAEWARHSEVEGESFLGVARAEDPALQESDSDSGSRFALFHILTQRRVLISSWALLVHGTLLSAFDAVCTSLNHCDNMTC